MRTTVNLERDVAAAVERVRRETGVGLSEALNQLVRAGLAQRPERPRFRQRTAHMGPFLVDVSNTGEALEQAEGEHHK